jgi:outer membrane protein assembly factor BamB
MSRLALLRLAPSLLALSLACLIASGPANAAGPPDAPAGSVTTFQQNALHDGLGVGPLRTPLTEAWSLTFQHPVSAPLVIGDRVFVAVKKQSNDQVPSGASLYALGRMDGAVVWGPIDFPGSYNYVTMAADSSRVYALNWDGRLRAFDQATGAQVWSVQVPGTPVDFTSPLTVRDGLIYFSSGGSELLYAVDTASGGVAWSNGVAYGGESSPVVTDDAVYVSFACEVSYKFRRSDGARLWLHETDCHGGGGETPVLHGDKLYVRDNFQKPPAILNTSDGTQQGTFASVLSPAFDGNVRLETHGSQLFSAPLVLTAVDNSSNAVLWSQPGDGHLRSTPVIMDGKVAMGSTTGKVFLFDEQTGQPIWSADTGVNTGSTAPVYLGLAVAENMLFVSADNTIVVYEPESVGGQIELAVQEPSDGTVASMLAAAAVVAGVATPLALVWRRRRRPTRPNRP